MANHTKAKCKKCGKELDTRGIRLHEMKCKGNQDQAAQSEAQQPAQTSGVKSTIKTSKPAAKPLEQVQTDKGQAKKKSFLDELDDLFD